MAQYQQMRVMVTVKAHPALSHRHGEVVCVAGVRVDQPEPTWIRLFPVAFRDLERTLQFKKYQLVDVRVTRPRSDQRPESYTPDMSSALLGEVISTGPSGTWGRRWELLEPLADKVTMCGLNAAQRAGRPAPSLAMIRPAMVTGVDVVDTPDFTEVQRNLAQAAAAADLFGEARERLEPSPFTVRYRWRCLEPGCSGHDQSCVDWEVGGAARRWLRSYPREEVRARLHAKFYGELCGKGRDTYFFAGNQHQHPGSYLVLGVFWPPHDPGRLQPQLALL